MLFVAHRIELIDQTVETLGRLGITEVGVIRADDKRTAPLMPVQVASIATLVRRELPWVPDLVFIDECHRAMADSYVTYIFDAFPDSVIIGLTASPIRGDGKPLGKKTGGQFDALEVAATYSDLIRDGFVAEPVIYSCPERPDLSSVHTVAGDFSLDELETAMRKTTLTGNIVTEWKRLSEGRRTVVFATGIAHSLEIVSRFHEAGVRAAHIDGSTPEEIRAEIGRKLRDGDLEVISNCSVYAEGWDEPCVKCLVLARPTKSLSLYLQTAGRALRPWNDVRPIILDHAGNFDRHGAPHEDREWNIDSPPMSRSEARFKTCPKCYAYIASNARECPYCGHSFAAEIREREIRETHDQLVKRDVQADQQQIFFEQQLVKARRLGLKPGFAAFKFKEKYGRWPPWAWSQWANREFAGDEGWKRRQQERQAARRNDDSGVDPREEDQKLTDMAQQMFDGWDPKNEAAAQRGIMRARTDAAMRANPQSEDDDDDNSIPF